MMRTDVLVFLGRPRHGASLLHARLRVLAHMIHGTRTYFISEVFPKQLLYRIRARKEGRMLHELVALGTAARAVYIHTNVARYRR